MKKLLYTLLLWSVCLAQTVFAADQIFFYHTDPAGTPLSMTNSSGVVVWKADYKPFGEENSTSGPAANDRRFVGKEKDEETGLSYFGARYENAKIGRFIAPDPVRAVDSKTSKTNEKMLANPQRLNTYAYALNNPYRFIDPDGRAVYLVARGLNDSLIRGFGVHTFIMLMPDSPNDFNGKRLWTIGGYEKNGKLSAEINNTTDMHWRKWKSSLKGIFQISAPNGKSDTEFISDIMTSFSKYKSESRDYSPFPSEIFNQGNCNNLSSGALMGAGVQKDFITNTYPAGASPGLGRPLQEMIR